MTKMICTICNKEIHPKDDYCRLTDYKKGEFYGENWYHTICYIDKLRNSVSMNK